MDEFGRETLTERLLGTYTQGREGNLILLIGGMHGNEVSGVRAIRTVMEILQRERPSFRGTLVGLAGNLGALHEGRRYLERDMNRLFDPHRLALLRRREAEPTDREEREALELANLIDRLETSGLQHQKVFLDLHATSAPGAGFSVIRDTESNREIAARMHLPLVFGLDVKLHATLMNYLYQHGYSGIAFEGGQIGTREAYDVHCAGIWTFLAGMGCIHPKDIPDYRYQVNRMIDAAEEQPKAARAVYRHAVGPGDDFRMNPGYRNFQWVQEGEVLARDNKGPIRAHREGMILMPLYQALGLEGFFLLEEVDY